MNNTIIDLIIRMKNGYMARKEQIELPYSRIKEDVLKKLLSLKYIKNYNTKKDKFGKITIELLYKNGEPAFTDLKIYSKPGRRWYVAAKDIKPVLGGLGASILSTPKGILTNQEAKKEHVGGELLFEIW